MSPSVISTLYGDLPCRFFCSYVRRHGLWLCAHIIYPRVSILLRNFVLILYFVVLCYLSARGGLRGLRPSPAGDAEDEAGASRCAPSAGALSTVAIDVYAVV